MAPAALAGSPFALLDARCHLQLVTDQVHVDDALCLALTCRALRNALWARFPRRAAAGDARRLRTRDAAVVVTPARLIWVRGLSVRPPWLMGPEQWDPRGTVRVNSGRLSH